MEEVFEVDYTELVLRNDLPAIDTAIRQQIRNAIETKLMVAPEHFGKPLRYTFKRFRSLRVGQHRILFTIKDKTVLIVAIFHRSDGYEDFTERLT